MTGEAGPDASAAPAGRRRPTVVAAVLLVVAAAILWSASRLTWVTATSSDGLGIDRDLTLSGDRWAPSLTPLALALVAAVAATFAVRGLALRIVAGAVAAVSVVAAIPALQVWTAGVGADKVANVAELPDRSTVTAVETAAAAPIVAIVAALIGLVAAVALWRTPREKAGLSSKYDAPAARREAAAKRSAVDEPVTERVLWDALDAGEDPTVDPEDDAETPSTGTESNLGREGDEGSGTRRETP